MADLLTHHQALTPVCRGTSYANQWTEPPIPSHPSAWQSSPFPDQYDGHWQRGFFSHGPVAPYAFEPPDPDPVNDVLFPNYTEPSQTEDALLDPALVVRLRLDPGEQYIVERYLRGESWETITKGFEQHFGASPSSNKSALMMRFTRLKRKHPEIRALAEEAFPKRHLRRRRGRENRWETKVQDEGVPPAGSSREGYGVPRKTSDKGKRHRTTQNEAALAADRLLAFLGQPEVQGLMAQSDYLAVVRLRSRLREQVDVF